jgi:hypothetical protein
MKALEAEGLDRPIVRPPSHVPSVRDLELVCWELIITPDMVRDGIPDADVWASPQMRNARLLLEP